MDYGKYKISYKTIKSALEGHILDIESVIENYEDYIGYVVFNEIKKYPFALFQIDDIKQEIQLRMLAGIRHFNYEKIRK